MASRARVSSFSFTSSACRAVSHSCGDTIVGVIIVCLLVLANRASQSTSTVCQARPRVCTVEIGVRIASALHGTVTLVSCGGDLSWIGYARDVGSGGVVALTSHQEDSVSHGPHDHDGHHHDHPHVHGHDQGNSGEDPALDLSVPDS